jgi:hypothetical protein
MSGVPHAAPEPEPCPGLVSPTAADYSATNFHGSCGRRQDLAVTQAFDGFLARAVIGTQLNHCGRNDPGLMALYESRATDMFAA